LPHRAARNPQATFRLPLAGRDVGQGGRPVPRRLRSYDWHFDADGKVQKLVILAEVMKVLAPGQLVPVMDWLSALPYPWCSTDRVLAHMPVSAGLGDLKTYLEQAEPISSGF
jgi:hypothetical protein